jgi:type I restriction enzyme R subunit
LTAIPQDEAVAVLLEKYEVLRGMLHGFDYSRFLTGKPAERLAVVPAAMEHILQRENGKKRCLEAVSALSKAFALSVPDERALAIRDEVAFFQALRAGIVKVTLWETRTEEELDAAVRQIVSKALASAGVLEIFSAAGLKTPDISIFSDEFLEEVRDMPQRNLALEALKKLLADQIKLLERKNLIQSRRFSEMLEQTLLRYQNRTIESAQVIAEMIELAREMREANRRGERLRMSEEELAFYDALEVNDSAVKIMGDEVLRSIARELVETIRRNTTIDWTVKESVRAKLHTMVKRILRKYGYPPDKQEKATGTGP